MTDSTVKPSNEELLPCPFCSGVAEVIRHGTHYQSCVVACRDCGCRHESNEQGTGRGWNTRAELQRRQQPDVSAIHKCCPMCGSPEVDHNGPQTKYECGSSDYDQRPGTFREAERCNRIRLRIPLPPEPPSC